MRAGSAVLRLLRVRLLIAVPVVVMVSMITFLLASVAPFDPLVATWAPGSSAPARTSGQPWPISWG